MKDEDGNPAYRLFDRGNGAADYEKVFLLRPDEGNSEVIFWYNNVPVGFTSSEIKVWAPSGEGFGGVGAVAPTQNFVDLYEMNNGKPITDEIRAMMHKIPTRTEIPVFTKRLSTTEVYGKESLQNCIWVVNTVFPKTDAAPDTMYANIYRKV